jgi:hypothetical protein
MSLPHGRAKVDSTSPRAFAICDRCGFLYNHQNLHWQYDFRGRSLANLRILVCEICEDNPQPQLKPRIIPPDPVPIQNARPERYRQYETDVRITQGNSIDFWTGLPISGGDTRITQDSDTRVTQQTGEPPFGRNTAPGSNFQVPKDNTIGLPYDNTSVPLTGPLPDFSAFPYWVGTNNQQIFWKNNVNGPAQWVGYVKTEINTFWQNNVGNSTSWKISGIPQGVTWISSVQN